MLNNKLRPSRTTRSLSICSGSEGVSQACNWIVSPSCLRPSCRPQLHARVQAEHPRDTVRSGFGYGWAWTSTANREAHEVQCSTGAVPAQRTCSVVLCGTKHCVTPANCRTCVFGNPKLSVLQAGMLENHVCVCLSLYAVQDYAPQCCSRLLFRPSCTKHLARHANAL